MTNIIKKFIEQEYTTTEVIFLIVALVGFVNVASPFLGNKVCFITGGIFMAIGLYGYYLKSRGNKK